ncbi:hypothetical protein [Streptomyces sp. NPDC001070]
MPSISDSCLLDSWPASVRQLAIKGGVPFPLSLATLIRNGKCPHDKCLVLHLKFVMDPDIAVHAMLVDMRATYDAAAIGVSVRSREDLTGPAFTLLLDLDVGACSARNLGTLTLEQTQLFANRNNVGSNEVVAYFVRSTVPASFGCSAHPTGQPTVTVARVATRWTLAHEMGHVLGIDHVDNPPNAAQPDRLMTGRGTNTITNPPPDLDASEIKAVRSSQWIHNCPK